VVVMSQEKKPPVQVRAYEAAQRHFDGSTPEGRYILSRLRTISRHAEKRRMAKALKPKSFAKSKLIRDLDSVFSRYIRNRDTWVDPNGSRIGKCCTCGRIKLYEDLDCGHFIRRENWGTRWIERNCHAQCGYCNRFRGGLEHEHEEYIKLKHGEEAPDSLRLLAKINKKKPSAFNIQRNIEFYENLK